MNQWYNTDRVCFRDIATHDNDGWVCNIYYSALFHFDMTTLEMNLVTELPTKDVCACAVYGPIEYFEDKLLIGPMCGTDILVYDIASEKIQQINIADLVGTNCVNLFQKIIIYDGNAYFIPGRSHNILCLNLNDYSVQAISDVYELLQNDNLDENRWLISDACFEHGKIYMSSWQSGKVVIWDCRTHEISTLSIEGINALGCCQIDNGGLYVSSRDTADIVLIKNNEKIFRHIDGPENLYYERGIRSVFLTKGRLFVVPYKGNMILIADEKCEVFRSLKALPLDYCDNIFRTYPDNVCCSKQISEDVAVYYSLFEGQITILNLKNNEFKFKDTRLNETDRRYVIEHFSNTYYRDVTRESRNIGIKQFLEFVSER